MEENWTILKVIQWTTSYFSRKGIEQPRAGAEVLLAYTLGVQRIELYLRYDQPLTPGELERFRDFVRRRAAREPTQYIIGRQEFWSLEFEVNRSVLIPRPETEVVVERALEIAGDGPVTVLDLGTGSGAIAVALAFECPSLRIVAVDKSVAALAVAKRNAFRHKVQDSISFIASDLFEAFRPSQTPFDLIVSNPPYIGEEEFSGLAPEVVSHEPSDALRGGGAHGLAIIRRIVRELPAYLRPGGSLIMEIGHNQAELLREELTENGGIESFEFIRDYSGIQRVLHLRTS